MTLADLYQQLGESGCGELLRSMSMGRLRTYQLYDRIKTRLHATKLNTETLRKIAPRVWQRLQEGDTPLGQELAQAVLISHLDMIQEVLNFLKIPHEDGFFAKDVDVKAYLKEGWQEQVYAEFKGKYPAALLAFYVNHLAIEVLPEASFAAPPAA
jgi:hypothetical protein